MKTETFLRIESEIRKYLLNKFRKILIIGNYYLKSNETAFRNPLLFFGIIIRTKILFLR